MVKQRIIGVVALIQREDGRFLVGKRSPHKEAGPNFWCPVSGKLEPGETEQEAVVREVREEVGLEVVPVQKLEAIYTRDGNCILHWWQVEIVSGEAVLANDEHTELRWLTLEEIEQLTPTFAEDIEVFSRFVQDQNDRNLAQLPLGQAK